MPRRRCYFAAQGPRGSHHDFLTVALVRFRRRAHAAVHGRSQRLHDRGSPRLAPGESAADDLDLAGMGAARPINGATSRSLPGDYALTATYRVDQPGAWAGSIVAGPVRLHV